MKAVERIKKAFKPKIEKLKSKQQPSKQQQNIYVNDSDSEEEIWTNPDYLARDQPNSDSDDEDIKPKQQPPKHKPVNKSKKEYHVELKMYVSNESDSEEEIRTNPNYQVRDQLDSDDSDEDIKPKQPKQQPTQPKYIDSWDSDEDIKPKQQPPKHKQVNKSIKEYHVELNMHVSNEYKRKNGWSKMYKQEEPITVSHIVFADNQEDAIQIASDKAKDEYIIFDSYYRSEINNIESSSALFIDDGAEPSGMYMRESSHLNYNDIIDCKDFDKRQVCVYLIILSVYTVHILRS